MTGRRRAIGRPTLRREHLAGGGFALLAAAFALTPTAGQSPAASDAAAPSGGPASSPGTDAAGPLPAWIARGSCEAPEDRLADLTGLVAGGTADRPPERLVYAGRTDLGAALADLGGAGRALLAGGDPAQPESAVACGSLDAPAQGDADLAIALEPLNRSGYRGTAQLHEADGRVTVVVVLVSPAERDDTGASPAPAASPSAAASPSPDASLGASASPSPAGSPQTSGDRAGGSGSGRAITSPIPLPSVQPGTSGAPPFSPLPQATGAS